MKPKDVGPWRGPTVAEWLERISPWPVPWFYRSDALPVVDTDQMLQRIRDFGLPPITESELRVLDGNR